MDVLKFVKEKRRLCDSMGQSCGNCPLREITGCTSIHSIDEKYVEIVEQWAKEHPVKTKQSQFLKQFPEAKLDASDVLIVCPNGLDQNYRDEHGECNRMDADCHDCRREFWGQEVE